MYHLEIKTDIQLVDQEHHFRRLDAVIAMVKALIHFNDCAGCRCMNINITWEDENGTDQIRL